MNQRIIPYLFLLFLSCVLSFFYYYPDHDIWARLAIGSYIVNTGEVLKNDIFSFTQTHAFHDHEWGSSVIFYLVARLFGNIGLTGVKVFSLYITFVIIYQTIKLNLKKGSLIDLKWFILIVLSTYYLIGGTVRSQMFTFPLFALWIYLLERVRKGEDKLLYLFPIITIVWANMHGGFVAGLGLLFMYAIGELLNHRPIKKYLITIFASLVATLINPYGISYLIYLAKATTMPRPGIIEWRTVQLFNNVIYKISFITLNVYLFYICFVGIFLFTIFFKLLTHKKLDWAKTVILCTTLYLSYAHQRHIVLFIIAISSLYYHDFCEASTVLFKKLKKYVDDDITIALRWLVSIGLFSLVVAIGYLQITKTKLNVPTNINLYPVQSANFILANRFKGNLACPFNWGSYLLWKLYPNIKVSIDGRYEEVYTDETYELNNNFFLRQTDNWLSFLDKYDPDFILLPKHSFNDRNLSQISDYVRVYDDNVSYVLVKKDNVQKEYIIPDKPNSNFVYEDLSKGPNFSMN